MKLDTISLPGATYSKKPVKKMVTFEYPYTDVNEVEERGLGICRISVKGGTLPSAAARDELEQACEAAGVKKLYFSSAIGQSDDRYYKVYTHPAETAPSNKNPDRYNYAFECLAADPAVYLTADDSAVW